MVDVNIGALRKNCYRQSKVPGEFMLQLRVPGAVIPADLLDIIKHVCNTWGDGSFHIGMRQTLNAPGIKAKDVPAVNEYIEPYIKAVECDMCGIEMDTSKGYPFLAPRNIMACIGGIHCILANNNTQNLAHKLEKIIYPNPYHVKISVAGCPNDCGKAHFQDFGFIGVTIPIYDIDRCIGCGGCVRNCEHHATRVLEMNDGTNKVDKDMCCCVGCGECVKACPTGAWRRPATEFWRIMLGARSGKQNPRMGKVFAKWVTTDVVIQIMNNWPKFTNWVLGGKPIYIHGGHLIDKAGYRKFLEMMLEGVTLNPEALIAENIFWHEEEYRNAFLLKNVDHHDIVSDKMRAHTHGME